MSTPSISAPTPDLALAPGDLGPERTVGPITRTDIVRYAGAGGDFNPIHHDETFAQSAGMPSVFSHGLLTAGLLGQYLAGWIGLARVREFGVRFTGQVWPDDILTLQGRVAEVNEATARVELTAGRQTGEIVLKGTASVRTI